jgi:hypothetical protein
VRTWRILRERGERRRRKEREVWDVQVLDFVGLVKFGGLDDYEGF